MSPASILVIGGTGAQGSSVAKELARDGKYHVKVLTRDRNSGFAQQLAESPYISVIEGNAHDENELRTAFHGVDSAFVNTNGFAIGEKGEIFLGIRMYEIARHAGIKHYVWATLEYASKIGDFHPDFHCGHLDGKAIVADYISAQATNKMAWTLFNSVPYMETLSEMLRPHPDPNDAETLVFSAPLGDAAMPLIALEDLGKYGRWVFDNIERSNGMILKLSTAHVKWSDLARDFTEITRKRARYEDLTLDEYFKSGVFPDPEMKVGHSTTHNDPTLQTYRQNFSGFWTLWKSGLVTRDYEILDEILPGRLKSVKEWMVKSGYTGKPSSVLKDYKDREKRS